MKTGIGFDSHRLAEGRPLVLGGVTIDHPRGLLGHSDGDCLIHAVCDALLGGMAEGDIGEHFPDTDPRWRNADSARFLSHVAGMLADRGLTVSNVDAVVVAAEPALGPHKKPMEERIASTLGVAADRVNVKAKRPEGFEGAGADVIAVFAVATVDNAVNTP